MPESLTTEAVVLRAVPYGDADLIVSLYTRALGRLSALARSARRSRKRFGAGLGPLVVSRAELRRRAGAELWTLSATQLQESHAALAGDVATYAHASYGTELIRELSPVEQPDEALLDLLIELYRTLSVHGAHAQVLRSFELALLDIIGLAPMLAACAGCGDGDHLDSRAVLDATRGGIVCARCAPASLGRGVRPISGEARAALVAAASVRSLAEAAVMPAPAAAGEARDALLAVLLGHVGKPLRSLEFISKMSAYGRQRRAPDP